MTEDWETGIFGLLAHPATNRVLMIPGEDGWALPGVQVEGRPELSAELATRELSRLLGVPVVAYRYARIGKDKERKHQEGVFVIEHLGESPGLSGSTKWASQAELLNLTLQNPDHRSVIDDYLVELETGIVPPFRRPWERPGWYAVATRWIETTMASIGRKMTAPSEQVRWWSLASVLRVPTSRGDVYFKASAEQPSFVNEGVLLSYLESLCPDRIPKLLATDPDTGWILLDDAGSVHDGATPVETNVQIVTAWAELQLATVPHVEELRALGCADRRPHTLIPLIESLLDDELVVTTLSSEEWEELRRRIPEIVDMCGRIPDYAVPPSLIHGDLHVENVITNGSDLIFLDWTEACISHPFMDMFMIFNERDDATHNHLRDAYLAGWRGFETTERLRELWSLCGVVHAIHHAAGYQAILHRTEARSRREMAPWLPFLLRKALRYLKVPA